MDAKEFKGLAVGDRVRLGGRKGSVRRTYAGWGAGHISVEFDNGTVEMVDRAHLDRIDQPKEERTASYDQALKGINEYRRSKGRRPLDPAAAGWSQQDVLIEYKRLVDDGSIKFVS